MAPEADSAPEPEAAPGVAPEAHPAPGPPPRSTYVDTSSTFRRVLEVAVMFSLAVVFLRAVAVEPFGVPTGSMAPGLIGDHRVVECPRCGYPIRVGEPTPQGALREARGVAGAKLHCPNCGRHGFGLGDAVRVPGDRLMVDKTVYHFRAPRRWEMAVFGCPYDDRKPYVKRVAGLPGEKIEIVDGDVFADGELARKTHTQCREVAVAVFDQGYAPAGGGGWSRRWLRLGVRPMRAGPRPHGPEDGEAALLDAAGRDVAVDARPLGPSLRQWVGYAHYDLDYAREEPVRDALAYNERFRNPHRNEEVHDFMVTFDVAVDGGAGRLAFRLDDGGDEAVLAVGVGRASGGATLYYRGEAVAHDAGVFLSRRGPNRLAFALFDRRATASLNGREVLPAVDLPGASRRRPVSRPFAFGVQGGLAVRLRRPRLFRDVHYSAVGEHGVAEPARLGPDEYFVLGDNTANSDDSRYWPTPGVPGANFLGKPFLLHQPSRGASWGLFGAGRAVDWGRIRWLR